MKKEELKNINNKKTDTKKDKIKSNDIKSKKDSHVKLETIQKEPETIQKEPETIQKEPETIQKEPETIQKEPETIQKEPETIQKEPETTQETQTCSVEKTYDGPIGVKVEYISQNNNTYKGNDVLTVLLEINENLTKINKLLYEKEKHKIENFSFSDLNNFKIFLERIVSVNNHPGGDYQKMQTADKTLNLIYNEINNRIYNLTQDEN